MFSAVVSRFENSAFSTAPTSYSIVRRVQARVYSTKEIRRHSGRFLFAAAQHRRKLSCAVQSDVTENAHCETALSPSEDVDASFEMTFNKEEDNRVSEAEPGFQVDQSAADVTPRDDIAASEHKAEDLPKDSESELHVRQEVLIQVQPSRHPLGVFVNVVDHESSEAFLPYRLFSNNLLSSTIELTSSEFIEEHFGVDALRKALVVRVIRSENEHGKNRYIISGKHFDEKILYKRLSQIRDLCLTGETLQATILLRNKGGLMVRLCGATCFLPRSYLTKKDAKIMEVADEYFESHYKNSQIRVCVKEVQSSRGRIIVSSKQAQTLKHMDTLTIGSLVHGKIAEIVSYGAFVQIDGIPRKGLLHVRNISQKLVYSPDVVFAEGDEVYAIVVDIDQNRERISLSTADLEEERGEMLYNRERVLQNAPIMAARLKQELERARKHFNPEEERNVQPSNEQD